MRTFLTSLAVFSLWASACTHQAAVRTARDLPIKEVVLYRNGVGYFERRGHFEGETLEFQVRASEVGDFLTSLTAIDTGEAGGVRSVSFETPEAAGIEKPSPATADADDPPPAPDPPSQPLDVRLHLAGKQHNLLVSYVVGTPIWRPSYRLVVDDQEGVLLQAWAVVQNTSGEDWRDVHLVLTTGAPIAFRSDLGTPIEPERPLVTDRGAEIQSVPGAEVSVAQDEPARRRSAPQEAVEEMDAAYGEMASKAAASAPAPPRVSAGSLERSIQTVATLSNLTESVTRYDLGQGVTVPDGGSTMVAVLSSRIPGARAHLFAPDPGVGPSLSHPFEVVRLENESGAVLEPGPVSVLGEGGFLGHGLLESLPRGAHAFIPFSVDKSLVVEPSTAHDEQEGRLIRVQHRRVTVERFSQRTTRYAVRNGAETPARVFMRHERWQGTELVATPEGTELTPGRALIPLHVGARDAATLEVVERTPVRRDLDFLSSVAATAVQLWLEGPAVDAASGPALKRALELRGELLQVQGSLARDRKRRDELSESARETRDNLKAIAKVKTANDLRTRLVKRLAELDEAVASLTQQVVDSQTRAGELEVRLDEALDGVNLSASKP